MPTDFGRRGKLDTRMAREIQASPRMYAENRYSSVFTEWGPWGYAFWMKQPEWQRVVYFAVQEGHTTVPDIASAVGLPEGQALGTVKMLENRGLIPVGVVTY